MHMCGSDSYMHPNTWGGARKQFQIGRQILVYIARTTLNVWESKKQYRDPAISSGTQTLLCELSIIIMQIL